MRLACSFFLCLEKQVKILLNTMTVCAEQHKSYGRQDYMEVSDESEFAAPENLLLSEVKYNEQHILP